MRYSLAGKNNCNCNDLDFHPFLSFLFYQPTLVESSADNYRYLRNSLPFKTPRKVQGDSSFVGWFNLPIAVSGKPGEVQIVRFIRGTLNLSDYHRNSAEFLKKSLPPCTGGKVRMGSEGSFAIYLVIIQAVMTLS